MSHDALIADLRRKCTERIRQLQADAEEKVSALRSKKEQEFARHQAEAVSRQASEAEKIAAPILHEARRSALATEDEALHRLVERLHALAKEMIGEARGSNFEAIFAGLVKEVPDINWEEVLVNPEDRELAAKYFPGSTIQEDPEIIGGFIASTNKGKYKVVNTLKRRLEKGWPMLIPLLLKEIVKNKDA